MLLAGNARGSQSPRAPGAGVTSSMGHYKSNVRDIEFNLFEVFGTDETLQNAPFEDLDEATARGILKEVAKLAEGPLAESFSDADRNPPVFDPATHTVKITE